MLELFANEFTILIFGAILSVISPVKGQFFAVLGLLVFKEVLSGRLYKVLLDNAVPVVVMGAIIFFSAIVFTSQSKSESLLTVCSYFFCILLGYIYGKEKNDDWIRAALLMLRNVAVFACLFSFVLEIVLGQRLVTSGSFSFMQAITITNPSLYRLRSFFGHAIVFGQMIVIALVINYKLETSQMKRLLFSVILIVALLLTKSRSAWIIAVGLTSVYLIFQLKDPEYSKWNRIAILTPILLLLVYMLYRFGLFSVVESRFNELGTDVSYSQRSGAIEFIFHRFLSKPFFWLTGNGYGSSRLSMLETTVEISGFSTVDNGFLAMLYEYGLLGLCSFVILLISAGISSFRSDCDLDLVLFSVSCVCCAELMFYCELGWWVPTVILFVTCGLVLGRASTRRSDSCESDPILISE